MKKKVIINFQDGFSEQTTIDLKTICPHCGIPIDPIIIGGFSTFLENQQSGTFAVLISCTSQECMKFHIQAFSYNRDYGKISNIHPILYSYKPILQNDLPEEINNRFSDFSLIYNQSLEAESMALDQIAGVGFRKSLEFLIKSYAIKMSPDSAKAIEKETLTNTIKNRYNDFPKIQKLAELATWIGNDETHFVKKHTAIDIQDMKRFIRSASLFIAADMDVDFATTYIEDDKAKRNQSQ